MIKRRLYKIDSEDAQQATFFEWLGVLAPKYPELSYFFSVPNGGYRNLITAVRLKRTGTKPGVLDIFAPIPRQGKHGLWIEMKTAKGTVSAEQKKWIYFLQSQNYAVFVCRSWTDAAERVIEYLELPVKL